MADKYRILVVLLGDQYLADCQRTIKPFDFSKVKIERHLSDEKYLDGKKYKRYEITNTGISPRVVPGGISHNSVMVDSDEHDEYKHITESASIRAQMNDKRLRKMIRDLEKWNF